MFTVNVVKMQTDKKATLVVSWFGASFISVVFSILFLIYISTDRVVLADAHNFKLYAAIPDNTLNQSDDISFGDGRPKIIEDFFKNYKSPLSNQSKAFVETADKYSLDYRLLPAIAMQESNGGKKVIKDSKNPFGYGIYGNLVIRFKSWEEAIERVGKALRQDYLDKGLKTPRQIMAKYTPPSLEKGGVWAKGVNSFMEELR